MRDRVCRMPLGSEDGARVRGCRIWCTGVTNSIPHLLRNFKPLKGAPQEEPVGVSQNVTAATACQIQLFVAHRFSLRVQNRVNSAPVPEGWGSWDFCNMQLR